ncbi:hypothetical protein Cni_G22015 [Canna indica]|uniref:Uncharacterized protein n=1 Tax=Canna indica TaxID=4628 RepID=A0AAQ3QL98_9LILI|nr:hypothetical protein Cni_G22015 [Canna indica]
MKSKPTHCIILRHQKAIHRRPGLVGSAGEKLSAAERAGELANVDPLVDAGLVEGMGAVAELADLVPGLEGREAHGADDGRLAAVAVGGEADDGEAALDGGGCDDEGRSGGVGEVGEVEGVDEVGVVVGGGEAEVEERHGDGELNAVEEVDDEGDGAGEDDGVADGGEAHVDMEEEKKKRCWWPAVSLKEEGKGRRRVWVREINGEGGGGKWGRA